MNLNELDKLISENVIGGSMPTVDGLIRTTPTKQEIKRFLEIFNILADFEMNHRHIRSWGCFQNENLPIQEVVKVLAWLTEMSGNE